MIRVLPIICSSHSCVWPYTQRAGWWVSMISTMSRELKAGVRGPPLYLELGLMTGALWLMTTRGPLRFLPNQFSNFDQKSLCSAIESAGVKAFRSVIIHLRGSGLHGAQIAAVEIRPHRAAEEIDAADPDLFIKQQFHMRMFGFLSHALNPLSFSFIGLCV